MNQKNQERIKKLLLFLAILSGIVIGCRFGIEMINDFAKTEHKITKTDPVFSLFREPHKVHQ